MTEQVVSKKRMDVRTSLAIQNNAVCIADIAALATPQGVPLPAGKGSNFAMVLAAEPCCDHQASRVVPKQVTPSPRIQPLYNTSEHMITTAGCLLQLPSGRLDALRLMLPIGKNFSLTYGQVIALSGDFYGDPNQPVCTAGANLSDPQQRLEAQITQFQKNFASMQVAQTEVQNILHTAYTYETVPIAARVRSGQAPSGVYAKPVSNKGGWIMDDEDLDFDTDTGGGGAGSSKFGRYTFLALSNLDHFGEDAITCYMAGHILAQRCARDAKTSGNPEKSLKIAYAINAFADHFLTDLFAAGHMRTPRRQMYDYKSSAWGELSALASGKCAKAMHDEDNKFGLWVENKRKDRWVAYGDARYRDTCNAANRRIMKAAIQQSMNDVWNAFNTGQIYDRSNCPVLDYLPTIITDMGQSATAEQRRDDTTNWAPLFWYNPDPDPSKIYIYQRDSLSDISVRTYTWKSVPGLTATAGLLLFNSSKMPQQQYTSAGYPYPPSESGPSGEVGWPPSPSNLNGYQRVWSAGATGQDLRAMQPGDWRIDGATGPTGPGAGQ